MTRIRILSGLGCGGDKIRCFAYAQGQFPEAALGITRGNRVTADGTICRCQIEHRLVQLLGHGHEAAIMLHYGQTVFIIGWGCRLDAGSLSGQLPIEFGRYAIEPPVARLDGTAQVVPGFLHNVPKRMHVAAGG